MSEPIIAPPVYRPLGQQRSSPRRWQPAWLAAAVVLVPLVYFLQQFTRDLRSQTLDHAPASMMASEEPEPPGMTDLTVASKFAVRMRWMAKGIGATLDEEDLEALGTKRIERHAVTRAERERVAIVAGELDGKEQALERLAALEKEAEPGGDLAKELSWLTTLYREGAEKLPDEAKASLVDRHGWFGRLALVFGQTTRNPERRAVVGGGWRVFRILMLSDGIAVISIVGGVVVLLVLSGMYRNGVLESHFDAAIGGPVYLEMFTVFAGGFLLVLAATLIAFGMGVEGSMGALAAGEVMMWCLVGALAWPLVRKVPWGRLALDLGLHRGQGVWREVGAGVLGWLAGVPLAALTYWMIRLVQGLAGAEEPKAGPEGFPLFQRPPSDNMFLLLLEVLSLVVWAPLVEETVFRGALYRYLRPRLKWWGAVLATSAVFGFVHPYTTAGLVAVGVSGLVFGLLREWRGSLIAPMVAHALHNASIAFVTVGVVVALGD